MNPVRYTDYILTENGERYKYMGLGEIAQDDKPVEDVYIFCKPVDGFSPPEEGRTRFLICATEDFATLFTEAPEFGEPSPEALTRLQREQEGE